MALAVGNVNNSPKKQVLHDLVNDSHAENNHILIFTEFRDVLDAAVEVVGDDCYVIHGDVALKKRPEIVDRFQETDGFAARVMQIRTGGIGLTCSLPSRSTGLLRGTHHHVNQLQRRTLR